ncbi:RimJ/RimL family protein N-acetyltransferase [Lysobacter enzymogenes]|jgi:RimJ/RimL family protein N-acetyltransferase|nr:Protein N-acetyltransferase, RimJ/RimL family [Lysobacter enzymogenes]
MMTIADIELETPRLILRPPRLEDFDAWADFMSAGDYLQYIGGPQPRPIAWRGMMSVIGSWAALGYGFFSVYEKSSGRWIGRLGPWQPEGWPGTEVGWGIVESEGGKGYASEGATAAIDWAFDHLGWSEVIHTIDAGNLASKGVARKLGSRYLRQDRLPEPFHEKEVEVWGQSREEWRARRKAGAAA